MNSIILKSFVTELHNFEKTAKSFDFESVIKGLEELRNTVSEEHRPKVDNLIKYTQEHVPRGIRGFLRRNKGNLLLGGLGLAGLAGYGYLKNRSRMLQGQQFYNNIPEQQQIFNNIPEQYISYSQHYDQ